MEDIGDEQEELLIIKKGTSVKDIRKYIKSIDILDKNKLMNKRFISYLESQGLDIFNDLKNVKFGVVLKNGIIKRCQDNQDSISQILGVKINP